MRGESTGGSNDDWKGERFIRKSVTQESRAMETKRLTNKIYHADRRKKGIPAPAARGHNIFIKLAVFTKDKR